MNNGLKLILKNHTVSDDDSIALFIFFLVESDIS